MRRFWFITLLAGMFSMAFMLDGAPAVEAVPMILTYGLCMMRLFVDDEETFW